jgi:hypothetical protein
MTTPEDPERDQASERVDLSKREPAGEEPFDPYRFGRPEHPIPAEYAPPGYTGPVIPTAPPTAGWGTAPPGANAGNPFSNPPGTPYAPPGADPGGYPPGPYPPAPYAPGPYPPAPPGQYPSPYGPPPGNYPPTPPQYGYGPRPVGRNGRAITALVLGIGSIVFCFFSVLDALLVIPGLIFGFIATSEAKAAGGTGRAMAVAGLVCSIVGGVLAAVFTALLVHAANQCGGLDNNNSPGWNSCVQNHLF